MTISPLPAAKALDTYFLEARSKLLDLAGVLDRISRGQDAAATDTDPRLERVRQHPPRSTIAPPPRSRYLPSPPP